MSSNQYHQPLSAQLRHLYLQALFRKIAAALPGMEALSSAKQEDLVDVNLNKTPNSTQAENKGGGCAC